MAKIQTLKNKENVIVYPQTHGTAVFVNEGEILQDKIEQYISSEEVGEVENVDITAELTSNKVTSIRDTSTNSQYPSAKAVYDFVSNMQVDIDSMKGFKSLTASMDNPVDLDNLTESGIYVIDGDLSYIFNGPSYIGDFAIIVEVVADNSTIAQSLKGSSTMSQAGDRFIEYQRWFTQGGSGSGWEQKIISAYNIEGNMSGVTCDTPTSSLEVANKSYVDNAIPDVSNFATKSEIPEVPTAVSELSNDRNYIASAAASPILVKYSWYGTQEQYDALSSVDTNTEYNIIEE